MDRALKYGGESATFCMLHVHTCMYVLYLRAFGTFTMESILAVAFGRKVDLHSGGGNEDQVLISAKTIFEFQKTGAAIMDPFTAFAFISKC